MYIPLMAVQLLCGRLLTSPSSHVTTFPSQKGQPGTPRSAKLEWSGPVSLSRGHLSSTCLSVLCWSQTLSGGAAQNREPEGGKNGQKQDGF